MNHTVEPGLPGTAMLCGLAGAGLGTVTPNAQVVRGDAPAVRGLKQRGPDVRAFR